MISALSLVRKIIALIRRGSRKFSRGGGSNLSKKKKPITQTQKILNTSYLWIDSI